jgi:anthranilate synthase component 1
MIIKPDLKEFKKLAKKHNLIVLSHKFYADWLTPLAVYNSLSKVYKGESFLLESVEGQEKICRYSFLGFEPIYTFKSKGRNVYEGAENIHSFETDKDPLSELKKVMGSFKVAPKEHLRFLGGFVGYAGYDIVRFYEPVGRQLPDVLKVFDSYFILPKYLIVFDHISRQIEILVFIKIDQSNNIQQVYAAQAEALEKLFKKIIAPEGLPVLAFKPAEVKFKSNFTKQGFYKAVEKAVGYIDQGENIQVVLSQRLSLDFEADPFAVYRYLRALNPSPYMFYLNFNSVKIAGSSPEMLLRCEDGELVTHPIAGTRKRGADENQDKLLQESLLADQKERAEHIMLVDLARNDLGRVAQDKSVKVTKFMNIEKFSHVMHIVSEVRAKLRKEQDIFSAMASCFPAGTLSGAPKVRAMQIINELETEARGIYGGAVGYFSFTNNLDTAIVIRTVVFKDKKAYIQAGGGVVSDSLPEYEYKETLNKAKAQLLAVKMAVGDFQNKSR